MTKMEGGKEQTTQLEQSRPSGPDYLSSAGATFHIFSTVVLGRYSSIQVAIPQQSDSLHTTSY